MGISAQFCHPQPSLELSHFPATTSRNVSERSYWRPSRSQNPFPPWRGQNPSPGGIGSASPVASPPTPCREDDRPTCVGRGWSSQTRSQLEWPLLGTKGPAVLSSWEQLQRESSEDTGVSLPLAGEVHRGHAFHWRLHSSSEPRSPQAFPRNCITLAVP